MTKSWDDRQRREKEHVSVPGTWDPPLSSSEPTRGYPCPAASVSVGERRSRGEHGLWSQIFPLLCVPGVSLHLSRSQVASPVQEG